MSPHFNRAGGAGGPSIISLRVTAAACKSQPVSCLCTPLNPSFFVTQPTSWHIWFRCRLIRSRAEHDNAELDSDFAPPLLFFVSLSSPTWYERDIFKNGALPCVASKNVKLINNKHTEKNWVVTDKLRRRSGVDLLQTDLILVNACSGCVHKNSDFAAVCLRNKPTNQWFSHLFAAK